MRFNWLDTGRQYLIVGGGGALGALARYGLGSLFQIPAGGFPLGTFVINLSGSFGLGLFLTLLVERYKLATEWRLFFATGVIGAYTTFSTFSNEVISLVSQGALLVAGFYSLGSLAGGLFCVWLGFLAVRLLAFKNLF